MKLFEQKKKLSLKEKVLQAERRELNAMASARHEKEQQFATFLKKTASEVEAVERNAQDIQQTATQQIDALKQEIAILENKKKELEQSVDEKIYFERRKRVMVLQQEMEKKMDALTTQLSDIEASKKSVAFILQEHEEAEEQLASDKKAFQSYVLSERKKLDGEFAVLNDKKHLLEALALAVALREEDAEKKLAAAEAQKQSNMAFYESLQAENQALINERKAIKDAYAELNKSRERILGKQS